MLLQGDCIGRLERTVSLMSSSPAYADDITAKEIMHLARAFILPVLAGPSVRLVKKRLCCTSRVKRVLPLTPLGFGLRAQG
jgi:hypothetical protein